MSKCGIEGCPHERHSDTEMCYWHLSEMSSNAWRANNRQAQLDRIEGKQTQLQDGLLIMIEKHRRIESKLDKLLEDRE